MLYRAPKKRWWRLGVFVSSKMLAGYLLKPVWGKGLKILLAHQDATR